MNIGKWNTENIKPILPIAILGGVFGGIGMYLMLRKKTKREKSLELKQTKDSCVIPIAELPPETRREIWTKLNYQELLNLRLVSHFTKNDIDNWVGVKATISSRNTEKYKFAQKVVLQSCLVTDLLFEIDTDFLAQPSLLRHLQVVERSSISLENLKCLIDPCINLSSLSLRFTYSSQVDDISEIVLNAITDMHNLKRLRVHRCATHSLEDKLVQPFVSAPNQIILPINLVEVDIDIPDISGVSIGRWLLLLEQQKHLKVIGINFGAIHWNVFTGIISKNSNLEEIILFGLKSYCMKTRENIPFDWGIFEHLKNLRCFEGVSPRTPFPIPHGQDCLATINFQRFPGDLIEKFHLTRIIISPEDVDRIYTEMWRMTEGSLNNIGEAGSARAAELSWILGNNNPEDLNNQQWLDHARERYYNSLVHCLIGFTMLSIFVYYSRNHQSFVDPFAEDDDIL